MMSTNGSTPAESFTEPPSTEPQTSLDPQIQSAFENLSQNYLIICISSVFVGTFLVIVFLIFIKRFRHKCCTNHRKLLETYSSVDYDDEPLVEELGYCDQPIYVSCTLSVGSDVDSDMDEPEYDCMSVDSVVSVNEGLSTSIQSTARGAAPSQQPLIPTSAFQSLWR